MTTEWLRENWESGQVTEPVGRPAYQEVADDLRRRIGAGEFPVGAAVPSTAKLTEEYRVSTTVVRAAIAELRADGVLVGRTGKGVFVSATPAAAAEQAVSVESLSREVGELRQQLALVERHLIALYGQVGRQYPGERPVVPDVTWTGGDGAGE